jgi:hypothetical protein
MAKAKQLRRVVGWTVDRGQRDGLLAKVPPRYATVVADHVTLEVAAEGTPKVPPARDARIVGVADDGAGVQALVVKIGGTTHRPDGSTYHITWSLGTGRKAVESNDVIRDRGWQALGPFAVTLAPGVIGMTR